MSLHKYKSQLLTVLLIAVGVLFSFCNKNKFENISRQENLDPFKELVIESTFNVYLTQDTTYSIRLEGSKEFVDQVSYHIENSKLYIKMNGRNLWLHPKQNSVNVYINSDSLHIIWANETSYVTTLTPIVSPEFGIVMGGKLQEADLDLNCHTFFFWNVHPCGGKLTLHGQCNELKLWNFALMQVDASALTTGFALVDNNAKTDCEVNVTGQLDYSILGAGNIILHGNPSQIVEGAITSTGKLIRVP